MNKYIINLIVFLLLSSITLLNSKETVSNEILFEKYECIISDFKLVKPNFNQYPEFKKFKTRISKACEEGVNFANKYTVVTWGCGTNCQYSLLVDRTNGKIFKGISSTYGLKYKKGSTLLIVNIPEYMPEEDIPLDTTRYYIVDEGFLKEIIP